MFIGGKVDLALLPALAIGETFVVASQAAMLALPTHTGDVAKRTDISGGTPFMLQPTDPTVLGNWLRLTGDFALTSDLSTEQSARAAGDITNAAVIVIEATARAAADSTNASSIATETTRAETAETTDAAARSGETRTADTRDPGLELSGFGTWTRRNQHHRMRPPHALTVRSPRWPRNCPGPGGQPLGTHQLPDWGYTSTGASGTGSVAGMQRVLDIDLDFFVEPVVHWPPDWHRPPSEEFSVWSTRDVLSFLSEQCGVRGRIPGFVTENHGELFPLWRTAVAAHLLEPPFHVTHVDAHADLGLGDNGYDYLMTSLLHGNPADRQYPATAVTDGNFLLFAIACRWIGDLVYVFGEGGGGDELFLAMERFDPEAQRIQLAAMTKGNLDDLLYRRGTPAASQLEPAVPYHSTHWEQFQAAAPYDLVCLTRSPPYTPPTADPLYDAIRETFIEPINPAGLTR